MIVHIRLRGYGDVFTCNGFQLITSLPDDILFNVLLPGMHAVCFVRMNSVCRRIHQVTHLKAWRIKQIFWHQDFCFSRNDLLSTELTSTKSIDEPIIVKFTYAIELNMFCNLTSMNLSDNWITNPVFLKFLPEHCPDLAMLKLEENIIQEELICPLLDEHLSSMKRLSVLNLSQNLNLGSRTLASVLSAGVPQLSELFFARNRARFLLEEIAAPQLKVLDMSENPMGSESVINLLEHLSRRCPLLTHFSASHTILPNGLSMWGHHFRDQMENDLNFGLCNLVSTRNVFPNLYSLVLGGNAVNNRITDKCAKGLESTLRDCIPSLKEVTVGKNLTFILQDGSAVTLN